MNRVSQQFPNDMTYAISLDTTRAVTAGMEEIIYTLLEALALVILVVFIFCKDGAPRSSRYARCRFR